MATGAALTTAGGEIFALADGALRFAADFVAVPRGATVPARIDLPVFAFLLRRPGQPLTLVDTGSGTLEGPECGHATQALAALGHEPGDIGRVIFTHLHGDHCGGFLDGLGATATEIVLSRAEAEYWRGTSHPASRVLAQASGRLVLVEDGDTVDAGLTIWSLPGHTPGHTGLIIDGKAALLGDCVHLPALQLADPMIATKYDDDTALAQRTRVAALTRLADEGLAFGGGHIADAAGTPAFLRIMAKRAGFVAVAP